jgi:hypothetical protein
VLIQGSEKVSFGTTDLNAMNKCYLIKATSQSTQTWLQCSRFASQISNWLQGFPQCMWIELRKIGYGKLEVHVDTACMYWDRNIMRWNWYQMQSHVTSYYSSVYVVVKLFHNPLLMWALDSIALNRYSKMPPYKYPCLLGSDAISNGITLPTFRRAPIGR